MYLELIWTFMKIGGLTFGGGYAMLPMLQREVVDNKGWATTEELMDYYAIGQCTPGIIAANTATFIGNKLCGIPGAILATLGVILPSLVIITVIASALQSFAEVEIIKNAFAGIRVCVCVLIFNAVVKLFKKSVVDIPAFCIFAAVFAVSVFTEVSPIIIIVAAAVTGVAVQLIATGKGSAK